MIFHPSRTVRLFCGLWFLSLPLAAFGQQTTTSLSRWFEAQTILLRTRYQYREDSAGLTATDAFQYQAKLQGRFKFDATGRLALAATVQTGNRFTVGWDNFTHGTGQFTTNMFLKHLYLQARPMKGVEYSIGGFDVLRGQATEITTYNNDAYMTGQRLTINRPKEIWFDEAAMTYGYLGDFNQPHMHKRYHRLKRFNYHQFLVTKNVNARLAVSADYTFFNGAETLHQAARFKTPKLKWLDNVTFEAYQRLDVNADTGFAVQGDKTLRKRVTLGAGFSQIDPRLPLLNADRVFNGKHLFTNNLVTITPELTAFVFLSRKVATRAAVPVKTRFEIGLNFNLLKTLQKAGLFK